MRKSIKIETAEGKTFYVDKSAIQSHVQAKSTTDLKEITTLFTQTIPPKTEEKPLKRIENKLLPYEEISEQDQSEISSKAQETAKEMINTSQAAHLSISDGIKGMFFAKEAIRWILSHTEANELYLEDVDTILRDALQNIEKMPKESEEKYQIAKHFLTDIDASLPTKGKELLRSLLQENFYTAGFRPLLSIFPKDRAQPEQKVHSSPYAELSEQEKTDIRKKAQSETAEVLRRGSTWLPPIQYDTMKKLLYARESIKQMLSLKDFQEKHYDEIDAILKCSLDTIDQLPLEKVEKGRLANQFLIDLYENLSPIELGRTSYKYPESKHFGLEGIVLTWMMPE